VVVLGNVIKSGAHSRGSGVVEDRGVIAFEVRDVTGFTPSGTKDWWCELPAAGADQWASRATRRKRRTTYRIAFVPSKFRIGGEPDPFVYQLDLGSDPWSFRLCTEDLLAAGHEARETTRSAAATGLQAFLTEPKNSTEAEKYLMDEHRLTREEARELLANQDGVLWQAVPDPTKRGRPKLLRKRDGVYQKRSAAEMSIRESPASTGSEEKGISADRMDRPRRKSPPPRPAPIPAICRMGFRPPSPIRTGPS